MNRQRYYFAIVGVVLIGASGIFMQRTDVDDHFLELSLKEQRDEVNSMIRKNGPEAAWQFVKKEYLDAFDVRGNESYAHALAHEVGKGLYLRHGLTGFATCDATFTDGCYHGFIVTMLQNEGSAAMSKVADLCVQSSVNLDCIHGVGHGLAEVEGSKLSEALAYCDSSFGDSASFCWVGVFMEHTRYLIDTNDRRVATWYPCDSVPQKYRERCAPSKPIYLIEHGHPTEEVGAFCRSAETNAMTMSCIESLGFAVVRAASGNVDQMIQECDSIGSDLSPQCIRAAAQLISSARYAEWQKTTPILCNLLADTMRKTCFNSFQSKLQDLSTTPEVSS